MRVLFWSGNFWPMIGGAEVLAAKLLPALRERGHEFLVVTSQSRPNLLREESYDGIPVHRLPFRRVPGMGINELIDIRRQVSRLKRDFAPDLIHVSDVGMGNFFHLITADAHPAPLLVTLHVFLSTQAIGHTSWLVNLIRSADWVSCVSAAVLEETRQRIPDVIPRSSVLYNGLDGSSFLPQPLPFESQRLLCLGRLIPRKGFDTALSAFASIVRRFPRARMTIAGDGPARAELERQTADLKLSDAVEFIGWVEPANVPALINTATLVVMPSRFEGLPLVALEAALMARPVVGTRAPGLSEVVVHQQTGLLVENRDCSGFADAIASLLNRRDAAIRMGREGRRRAETVFSWERCVTAYDALYRQLVPRGKTDISRSATL